MVRNTKIRSRYDRTGRLQRAIASHALTDAVTVIQEAGHHDIQAIGFLLAYAQKGGQDA